MKLIKCKLTAVPGRLSSYKAALGLRLAKNVYLWYEKWFK